MHTGQRAEPPQRTPVHRFIDTQPTSQALPRTVVKFTARQASGTAAKDFVQQVLPDDPSSAVHYSGAAPRGRFLPRLAGFVLRARAFFWGQTNVPSA